MNRIGGVLAVAALTASLAACGDDDSSDAGSGDSADYCDLLTNSVNLTGADPTDKEAWGALTDKVKEMAGAAPSDLEDDWQVVVDAFVQIGELDLSSEEEIAELENVPDLEEQFKRIEEHASSECGVEFQ